MAAALTAGTVRLKKAFDHAFTQQYTVASAATVHPGSLCVLDATDQRLKAGHIADARFAGVCIEDDSRKGNTAGTVKAVVAFNYLEKIDATGATAGDQGKDVYLVNDNTIANKAGSGTAATNAVAVGELVSLSSGNGWVRLRVFSGTDSH